jgi:predicted Zn-dependent protease
MFVLLTACAPHGLSPIGAGGAPFQAEADEVALWARAEKEVNTLLERTSVYDDPLLDDYLARVVERLVPAPMRTAGGPAITVRVLRDPALNAFAMANGPLFVHTGLLSALDNEAQLAAVLAHEITHVSRRHALQVEREPVAAHSPAEALELIAAAASRAGDGAVLSRTAGAVLGPGLPLSAVASVHGYGRALEREADRGAADAMVRAGYDAREAARLFATLRRQSGERGPLELFVVGRRAGRGERIEGTGTFGAASVERSPAMDAGEFQERMRAVVRDNAYEDIRAGRFALAQRQLDRVLSAAPDAIAHRYYGDLHRIVAQRARAAADRDAHARRALASYERAIELDPVLAEAHRQLGLLYYQGRETAKAREAFERYLALAPGAPDAARISAYIAELDR